MIISVHIPKAAGTSLLEHWIALYGEDAVCVDYNGVPVRYSQINIKVDKRLKSRIKDLMVKNPLTEKLLRFVVKRRVENAQVDLLNDPSIKVIHGHFPLDRYLSVLPDADIVTVLREPWERAISHFLYWKDNYEKIRDHIPDWFTPQTTFSEFIRDEAICNIQSKYLCGKDLNELTIVGTKENFKEFVEALYDKYGEGKHEIEERKSNIGANRELFLKANEDLANIHEEFEILNFDDIKMYTEFTSESKEPLSELTRSRVSV